MFDKFDENNNNICSKFVFNPELKRKDYEQWYTYDERGNLISNKDSNGYKTIYKYNENNKIIYEKDSSSDQYLRKYDEKGREIYYNDYEGF